jgi:hypothetical protein
MGGGWAYCKKVWKIRTCIILMFQSFHRSVLFKFCVGDCVQNTLSAISACHVYFVSTLDIAEVFTLNQFTIHRYLQTPRESDHYP